MNGVCADNKKPTVKRLWVFILVVVAGITTKNPNPLIAIGPSGISCQEDAEIESMCHTYVSHLGCNFIKQARKKTARKGGSLARNPAIKQPSSTLPAGYRLRLLCFHGVAPLLSSPQARSVAKYRALVADSLCHGERR